MLERIAPRNIEYKHDKTWHDGTAHGDVRASLISPSLAIPFIIGEVSLGLWEQIILVEFDIRIEKERL
jgi:thiamine phosphate synthase YjbQ (UPF0047 family)